MTRPHIVVLVGGVLVFVLLYFGIQARRCPTEDQSPRRNGLNHGRVHGETAPTSSREETLRGGTGQATDSKEGETVPKPDADAVKRQQRSLTAEDAERIARRELEAFNPRRGKREAVVERRGDQYIVTFPVDPPAAPQLGADYYGKIIINAKTGEVVGRFAPND